jgi:hypothetical protein
MRKQIATGMLLASLTLGSMLAQATKKADKMAPAPAAAAVNTPAPAATPKAAKAAVKGATDAEIADAKAKGMVWVNTGTKVYHKSGRFYGKTKEGKFMTEVDAQKAGFTAAKSEIGEKKPAAKMEPKPTAKK